MKFFNLFCILFSLVKSQYDFSRFPTVFKVAPPTPEFTAKYDLSNVPNIAIAQPTHAINPPTCSSNAASSCNWGCTNCLRSTDIFSCPNKQDWGVAFDDGPSPFSPHFLDYLDQISLKISFFVVGSQIVLYPDVLKQEFDRGHHVVSHTWSHRALTSLTNEEIVAELEWTSVAIEMVTGYRPKYFRPPFGDLDDRVRAIASAMGLKPIMWNYDTNDWRYFNADPSVNDSVSYSATKTITQSDSTITMYTQSSVEPAVKTIVSLVNQRANAWQSFSTGVISLEHDLYNVTASFGPPVIKAIMDAGMHAKSVAACIGDNSPYFKQSDPIPTISLNLQSSSVIKISGTSTATGTGVPSTSGAEEVRDMWFWTIFLFQQIIGLNN